MGLIASELRRAMGLAQVIHRYATILIACVVSAMSVRASTADRTRDVH